MKKNVGILILTLIFLLGLLLRTVKLTDFPVSFTNDELAIAYNSHSILKTGKDEWGNFLPLSFRSVGDYKSPLLIYLMVPAIGILGLNEFSTRITIALIGAITVLVVFYIAKKLTGSNAIALIAALLLAISPWHINPSRITHDMVLGLFLVLLAVAFFLKSEEKKFKGVWISAVFFALSLYAYHAQKIFSPLLALGLFLICRKELGLRTKGFWKALIIGFILVIPAVLITFSPTGRVRADMTFITKDFEINRFLHKGGEQLNLSQQIFDNNFILTFNFWTKRYLDYSDLNFWFIKGLRLTLPDSPDIGLLYLIELPFFLFGAYLVLIKNILKDQKKKNIVIIWILAGPIAASLANNYQHIFRNLTMVPIPQLLSAVGLWHFFAIIKSVKLKVGALSVISLLFVISLIYFLNLYFVNYPLYHSELLFDGWKQAASYALENSSKYKEVVIDPRFGTLGPYTVANPYLYVLFYGQIPPKEYLNDRRRKERYDSADFKNFTFRSIDWSDGENSDKNKKNTLFIGSPWVLPSENAEVLAKFNLFNGKEVLRAVSSK